MIEFIFKLILCHFVGDYVLQNDFIAKTKGKNAYHLFIHCLLYILPFYICFGFNEGLIYLFVMHLIIDPMKATWNKINYFQDQLFHFVTLVF